MDYQVYSIKYRVNSFIMYWNFIDDNNWYMNKKIKNLILLNNLYEENLQTIITNIEKEKHNQIQKIKNLYGKKRIS